MTNTLKDIKEDLDARGLQYEDLRHVIENGRETISFTLIREERDK